MKGEKRERWEREWFIDNQLVRFRFISELIERCNLVPWRVE